MSSPRRVVVTGVGLVCSLAEDAAGLHAAACAGEVAGGRRPELAVDGMPAPLAAPHERFDPRHELGKVRPLDRTGRLAAAAARRALEDAGWTEEALAEREVGLVLGTMFGSLRTITGFDQRGVSAGPSYAKPMQFANSVINAAAGQTAIRHDLRGVNATVSGDLTSGLQALAYAADLVRSGRIDAVLAGGAEEVCRESLYAFHKLGLLCRPEFDRAVPGAARPSGVMLGEAGALLMLESAESARRRETEVLAEILGHGSSLDPSRGVDGDRTATAIGEAVRFALADGGRRPRQVDCLSLGANGTHLDAVEAAGLRPVFDDAGAMPALASKATVGETLGAAGALQALLAITCLRRGELPGVPGLAATARDGLPRPRAEPSSLDGTVALATAVGLQGRAAALLLDASG